MQTIQLKAIRTVGQRVMTAEADEKMAKAGHYDNLENFDPRIALRYAEINRVNTIFEETGLKGNAKPINPEVLALEQKVADTEARLAAMSEEMAKQTQLMTELLAKVTTKK